MTARRRGYPPFYRRQEALTLAKHEARTSNGNLGLTHKHHPASSLQVSFLQFLIYLPAIRSMLSFVSFSLVSFAFAQQYYTLQDSFVGGPTFLDNFDFWCVKQSAQEPC